MCGNEAPLSPLLSTGPFLTVHFRYSILFVQTCLAILAEMITVFSLIISVNFHGLAEKKIVFFFRRLRYLPIHVTSLVMHIPVCLS